MKTRLYALLSLSAILGFASCDPFDTGGSGIVQDVFVYVTGDSNRTVQIAYLEREKLKSSSNDKSNDGSSAPDFDYGDKNVIVTEQVTLPFFKTIHCVGGKEIEEAFLEVVSENDSTTKGIIFDMGLLLEDSICGVFSVWLTENAVNKCFYCKDLPKDSVLTYLKRVNYPCYLEVSQGYPQKKVMMRDYWGY
jgi:hypothetical protein